MRVVDGRSNQEDDDTVTVNGGMLSGQGHSLAAPPRLAPGFKPARPGRSLPGLMAAPQGSGQQDGGADSSSEQESSRGDEHVADEDAGLPRLKRLRAP